MRPIPTDRSGLQEELAFGRKGPENVLIPLGSGKGRQITSRDLVESSRPREVEIETELGFYDERTALREASDASSKREAETLEGLLNLRTQQNQVRSWLAARPAAMLNCVMWPSAVCARPLHPHTRRVLSSRRASHCAPSRAGGHGTTHDDVPSLPSLPLALPLRSRPLTAQLLLVLSQPTHRHPQIAPLSWICPVQH